MLEGGLRDGTSISAFCLEAQFAHLLIQTFVFDSIVLNFLDRLERPSNLHGNDLEKNQVAVSRNFSTIDHGDLASSNLLNETPRSGLIALEGCCSSEASRLLNERMSLQQSLKRIILC